MNGREERQPTTDPIQGPIVHEYDGILEADNHLPRWWLGIFWATIVFAVLYWEAYEIWGFAEHPLARYRAEAAARAAEGAVQLNDDVLAELSRDPEVVARGARTFAESCAVCHGARGEGRIGPNLTDAQWIHGGRPVAIHDTIRDGVGARGMPAWGPVLGEAGVQAVTAFVLTIAGGSEGTAAPEGAAQAGPGGP